MRETRRLLVYFHYIYNSNVFWAVFFLHPIKKGEKMCQKFFPDTRVIIISRIFGALLRTEFEGKKGKFLTYESYWQKVTGSRL